MSTWVDVNGAKIEKEFLEENVSEARGYDWVKIRSADLIEHVHCIICGISIDPKAASSSCIFKSKGGVTCSYCYKHFLS